MRKVKPLRSTNKEKADCVAAFKKHPSTHAWCCHHRKLFEELDDPMDRVSFISRCKPPGEKPSRLRSFRPVKGLTKIYEQRKALQDSIAVLKRQIDKLEAERNRLWSIADKKVHKLKAKDFNREWPDNTWDRFQERVQNT